MTDDYRGAMVDRHEVFESFLWTGSGSQRVTLELGTGAARLELLSGWMGRGDVPVRCELRCVHRPLGPAQGVLELVGAATSAAGDAGWAPVPEPPHDEAKLARVEPAVR